MSKEETVVTRTISSVYHHIDNGGITVSLRSSRNVNDESDNENLFLEAYAQYCGYPTSVCHIQLGNLHDRDVVDFIQRLGADLLRESKRLKLENPSNSINQR